MPGGNPYAQAFTEFADRMEKIAQMFGLVGDQVGGPIGMTVNGLGEFRDRMTAMGKAMVSTTAASGALNAALNLTQTGISAVTSRFSEFVNAWNPSEMNRFRFAVTDMNAAIGRALTPTLIKLTEVFRTIGDAIASAGPSGQRLIAALATAAVSMTVMTAATFAFSSAVNSATFGLSAVIGAVAGLGIGMGFVLKPIEEMQTMLAKFGEVISSLLNVFGKGAEAVAQAITPAMGAILDTLMGFVQVLANVANAAIPTGQALWGRLGDVIQRVAEGVKPIVAVFEQLLAATLPISAALGNLLVGFIESMAPILTALGPLAAAFGRIGVVIVSVVSQVMAAIQPLMGVGMRVLTASAEVLADVLTRVAIAINTLADYLMNLLGIAVGLDSASTFRDGASEGMGVRNARIGSLEQYGQAALTSAFSLGMEKEDPAKASAGYLKNIDTNIGNIYTAITGWISQAGQKANQAGNVISDVADASRSPAWYAARQLANSITGR
jgi:hypothetical protein